MKHAIHKSHRMGKSFSDVRAPAGTPRFYGVRECRDCGGEEIEHAAGQFTDDALVKPCRLQHLGQVKDKKQFAAQPRSVLKPIDLDRLEKIVKRVQIAFDKHEAVMARHQTVLDSHAKTSKATMSAVIAALIEFCAKLRPAPAPTANTSADQCVDMLHRALGNRTGTLRVSDAHLICGIEAGKANQDQFSRFGRAIRELGWERQRKRFGGGLKYAYVKGIDEQRAVELHVEYDSRTRAIKVFTDRRSRHPRSLRRSTARAR